MSRESISFAPFVVEEGLSGELLENFLNINPFISHKHHEIVHDGPSLLIRRYPVASDFDASRFRNASQNSAA